jgi:uncharacterized protein (TIGR02594 family)
MTEPLWLQKARDNLGLKEIVGPQHEKRVLQFYAEAGHPEIKDDETAWCAAFANAMLYRAGVKGTGALNARSFLTWGQTVELKDAKPGDLVIYKRGDSAWQGHVNFFLRTVGDKIEGLGGNQGNAVSITTMPKASLLGVRRPILAKAPAVAPVTPPAPAPVCEPPVVSHEPDAPAGLWGSLVKKIWG